MESGEGMTHLRQNITATVRPGDASGFVAECLEIAVVTQGPTLDDTIENLREAVALHLDGEDPAAFGLRENPTLLVTIEVDPTSDLPASAPSWPGFDSAGDSD